MTGRNKKTTGTDVAKYNISKAVSGEVDKVAKKNGRRSRYLMLRLKERTITGRFSPVPCLKSLQTE